MVKNIVTISLTIFVLVVVGILGFSVISNQNKVNQPLNTNVTNIGQNNSTINQRSDEDNNPNDEEGEDEIVNNNSSVTNNTPTPGTGVTITMSQVAKHNSINDCWMIINNGVYNITNYIPIHPGGPGTITPYCGKDGTTAFDTKGGRGSHSQSAQNMLTTYYVGNISR